MPYVTWTRRLQVPEVYPWSCSQPYNPPNDVKRSQLIPRPRDAVSTGQIVPQQKTFSFRSKGGDSVEDDLLAGGISGSTLKKLRSDPAYKSSSFDTGHPFWTYRESYVNSFPVLRLFGNSSSQWFRGPIKEQETLPKFVALSQAPDLVGRGTRFIAQTRPNKSPADLAQALIELRREGLPRLLGANAVKELKRHASVSGALGSEFLNAEFGWKPLIRDVREAAQSIADSEKILKDWRAGSEKITSRRRSSEAEFETVTINHGVRPLGNTTGNGDWSNFFHSIYAVTTETVETVRKYSFSGGYSYIVPEVNGALEKTFQEANHLLGLELTPELLWNVLPWTWLLDWVWNIGDVISNASHIGQDGLVLRYGYVMCTTVSTRTYTMSNVQTKTLGVIPSISTSYRTVRKDRIRASPYGFAYDSGLFNPKQWAILAALGLTKSSNTLRLND